jgi:hypothetical protein
MHTTQANRAGSAMQVRHWRQTRHGRSYRWGGLAGKQAQQRGKGNMRHITQHNARKARDGSAGQENAR